jgi:DNA modification methylase
MGNVRTGKPIRKALTGSMTTGRAAYQEGINSINIELHGEYCRLSLKMLNDEIKNRFVQVEFFEA